MANLLDEYQVPGMDIDPEELKRLKYQALIRLGLGMAGREPPGQAIGQAFNTMSEGRQGLMRERLSKIQEARAQMQYAQQAKKAEEAAKQQEAMQNFVNTFDTTQLRAAGISPEELAYTKLNPSHVPELLKKLSPQKMSPGDVVYVPGIGMIDGIPDKDGMVNVQNQKTGEWSRRKLSGQTLAVANEAFAVERAKALGQAGAQFRDVPVAGGAPGETEPVLLSNLIAEQTGQPASATAGSYAGVSPSNPRITPQVQAGNDQQRMAILQQELRDAQASGNATNIAAIQQEMAIAQRGPGAAPGRRINRPLPPEGFRPTATGELEKVPGGPKDTTEQDIFKVTNAVNRANIVMQKIAETKKDVGWSTAGPASAIAGWIPGTPQYDLVKSVDMLKANIGFQELSAMRAASPTGGALGQVAIQELNMLQATLGSLDTKQSPDALKKSLDKAMEHFNNWKRAMEKSGAKINRGATDSFDADKTASALTPEEQSELEMLRKRFGR